jgi:hypothetical protein
MASSLRTGRKTIPVHPVRIRHVEPNRTHRRQKKSKLPKDEQVKVALKELRQAAYDQNAPVVARLERKLDHLLR